MYDYKRFLQEFEEFKVRARQLFEDRLSAVYGGGPTSTGEWMPPVDVYESADQLTLVAECAGVRREDIRIEVAGNVLTLRGVRPFESRGVPPERFLRMERSYGEFVRAFNLPYAVDERDIRAVFRNGVLKVTMQRAADAGRRIGVEVAE